MCSTAGPKPDPRMIGRTRAVKGLPRTRRGPRYGSGTLREGAEDKQRAGTSLTGSRPHDGVRRRMHGEEIHGASPRKRREACRPESGTRARVPRVLRGNPGISPHSTRARAPLPVDLFRTIADCTWRLARRAFRQARNAADVPHVIHANRRRNVTDDRYALTSSFVRYGSVHCRRERHVRFHEVVTVTCDLLNRCSAFVRSGYRKEGRIARRDSANDGAGGVDGWPQQFA